MSTLYGVYQAEVKQGAWYRRVDFGEVKWTSRTLLDSYQGVLEKDLATYEKRQTILIAKVSEFGSTPIFVTQPFRRNRMNHGIMEGLQRQTFYNDTEISGLD